MKSTIQQERIAVRIDGGGRLYVFLIHPDIDASLLEIIFEAQSELEIRS